MKHLDLFSGIGGFALAVDTVWTGSEHIFCEIDPFCQRVLLKHWPNSKIYGDIREITQESIIADTSNDIGGESSESRGGRTHSVGLGDRTSRGISLLTGGFPCQPFSQAGKRKGTEDNRHLWPEMFRVIQLTKPKWVIAENVRGILTIEGGMVFEQVCLDLEGEGYEVQPLIIPAVAVNAPHRRDRVWFIAHRKSWESGEQTEQDTKSGRRWSKRQEMDRQRESTRNSGWNENWLEVATEFCSVDDELPVELDEFKLSKSRHRAEQLKAYGNAIVPQVAIEIMKAIKLYETLMF